MRTRTNKGTKRSFAAVIAAAMIASILALVATPAAASATVTTKRYSGLDRYATAAAVAEATYATATKAILVSGENFADGLSASVLSGAAGAPVFLTQAAALPAVTAAAMGRVMTTNKTIYVVGGVNAVGAGVVTTLTGLGYTVTRIAGADRASTAVAVANKAKEFSALGTHTSLNTAIVVSDTAYADAVVAGGLSENGLYPILLTNGTSLTAATKAAFATTSLNIKQVIIVGGTSAVSASVEAEILADSNVSSIIRIGGTNRQDTAKKFAEKLTSSVASGGFAWSKAKATIVTSNGFADALASAQFNGTNNSVLLYTADNVPAETSAYVSSATVKAALTHVYAIGGTSAVPADVLASVDTLGTYATSAVTIGAAEGSNVVTVTFPALMKTADMVLANVKINNAVIDNAQDVALNGAFCVADYVGTIKLAVASHTFKVGNMVRASCNKSAGSAAILQGDLAYNAATTAKVDVISPVLATTSTTVTIAGTVAAGTAAAGTLSTMVDACVKSSGNATATGYKVMACYLDVPVSAGDTINVAGIGDLATGTSNKSTTVTVANSTLDPSCASQVHYAGAAATSFVTFNGPVNDFAVGDITVISQTTTRTVSSVKPITGTNTWQITWSGITTAGDTVKVKATAVVSANGEGNAAACAVGTFVTSSVKPQALSATATTKHTVSATQVFGTNEDVTVKAIATGAAQGVHGNAYKFAWVDLTNSKGKIEYTAASKTFTMSYDVDDDTLGPNAVEMAAVMNANTTFASMFTAEATATANTGFDNAAAAAAALTTVGVSTVAATVNFNEQLLPSGTSCAAFDLNARTGGADLAAAACSAVTGYGTAANAQAKKVKVLFTLNTTSHATYNLPIIGTSIIEVAAAAIDDMQGNGMTLLKKITLQ